MEIFMTKTELKELNVQQAIYYYDINTIEINKETAGIITIDLDFFNQLPKIITDYSRIIFCEAKNSKIIINKHCPNCSKKIFSDVDIDYGALHAATDNEAPRVKTRGIITAMAQRPYIAVCIPHLVYPDSAHIPLSQFRFDFFPLLTQNTRRSKTVLPTISSSLVGTRQIFALL